MYNGRNSLREPDMNSPHAFWSRRHFLLHDPLRFSQPGPDEFTPQYWLDRQAVTGQSHGRGITYFVQQGQQHWVLRHYRRGGLIGKLIHDRYLYTGIARCRPVAEFRLLQQLHQQGLPVPRPIGAHVHKVGLWYRGDLLIERIDGARDLVAWLQQQPLSEMQWQAVGQLLRRFHDAGVYHADLNSHNILMNDAKALWLIDFDRGAVRAPGVWQEDNLARLLRSLNKEQQRLSPFYWQQQRDWPALMAGYEKGA